MLKNAVAVAALLVSIPSVASAEYVQTRKTNVAMPRTVKANVEATTVAMNAALTVDNMVDKINTAYITGLRRCYNKGLAVNPGLKGKITVTFTISSYGNVSGDAEGISKDVDTCVANQLRRWNFGRPVDKREASYRINLVLAQ
jgi:hypothetical protein